MNDITFKTIEEYEKDFQRYGLCPSGVGWGLNTINIRRRYNNFVSLANLSTMLFSNLIDLGCGYGEFLKYTPSLNLTNIFQYYAVEPNSGLLSSSRHLINELPNHKKILFKKFNSEIIDFCKLSKSSFFSSNNTLIICNGVFTQKFQTSSVRFEGYLLENLNCIFNMSPLSSLFVFNTMNPHPSFRLNNLFYPSKDFNKLLSVKSESFGLDLTINFDETLCESYYCFKRK